VNAWLEAPATRWGLGGALCVLLLLGLLLAWNRTHRLEGARQAAAARMDDLQARMRDAEERLAALERVQEAQVSDARRRHDDGVSELLGSLLHLNEEIRSVASGTPATRAAVAPLEEAS